MMMQDCRGRKRNAKKNRSKWAKTSSTRTRPKHEGDFQDLRKGQFKWTKG